MIAGEGAGRLTWRHAGAVLLTGVAAGVAGIVLTLLLHAVQHVAFGYTENTFLIGVEQASPLRRVIAVGAGGVVAGLGWWLHRRRLSAMSRASDGSADGGRSISVTHALAEPVPRMPVVDTSIDALLQLIAIGAGASLGREGAPRQVGAALAGGIAARFGLTAERRRVLLAAGAGAGLAAVYNVPFGGAAFTLEVLLGTLTPATTVVALVTSWLAALVAWPVLGNHATYQLGHAAPAALAATVAAPLLGAALGPLAFGFRAAMTYARAHAPTGWRAALAIPITFTALGALAIAYPQLLGNGKSLAELDFTAALGLGTAVVLAGLKPLATAACLRSGAIGGLLTPSLATGATLGLLAGHAWAGVWPGSSPTSLAVIAAAGFLAVAQRAPVTAVILTAEFTHAQLVLLPAIGLTVVAATMTAKRLTAVQHSRS
ncbi:MAG TPA: chloride channel protein [Jatrophihabitans sp.]|nr:chloride channel protein [Jatrophihabitans sp.]